MIGGKITRDDLSYGDTNYVLIGGELDAGVQLNIGAFR